MNNVFARVGRLLLIVALLGATGAHWAVLQSVAWANMLADNARTEGLGTAIVKTFDGKNPCALCKQIAQGRQSENKAEFQSAPSKLDFLNQSVSVLISPPRHFRLLGIRNSTAPSFSSTPLVPPPRVLQG